MTSIGTYRDIPASCWTGIGRSLQYCCQPWARIGLIGAICNCVTYHCFVSPDQDCRGLGVTLNLTMVVSLKVTQLHYLQSSCSQFTTGAFRILPSWDITMIVHLVPHFTFLAGWHTPQRVPLSPANTFHFQIRLSSNLQTPHPLALMLLKLERFYNHF